MNQGGDRRRRRKEHTDIEIQLVPVPNFAQVLPFFLQLPRGGSRDDLGTAQLQGSSTQPAARMVPLDVCCAASGPGTPPNGPPRKDRMSRGSPPWSLVPVVASTSHCVNGAPWLYPSPRLPFWVQPILATALHQEPGNRTRVGTAAPPVPYANLLVEMNFFIFQFFK